MNAEQTAERILAHVRDTLPSVFDERAVVEIVREAYRAEGVDFDAEAEAQAAALVADFIMRRRLGTFLGFLDANYH